MAAQNPFSDHMKSRKRLTRPFVAKVFVNPPPRAVIYQETSLSAANEIKILNQKYPRTSSSRESLIAAKKPPKLSVSLKIAKLHCLN
jgi:hypothetical protein